MPWTGSSFAERHNHKLKGSAADTAARMATAMVRDGMDEGKAIRIANAKGDKLMRADGGAALASQAYGLAKQMAKEQEAASNVEEEQLDRRGGFDMGGAPQVPFFERSEAYNLMRNDVHPGGLVNVAGPGRTDTVNSGVRSGAYVIPADVVSGLGSGATAFGADVMDRMLRTNPYGIQSFSGHGGHGVGIPRPPAPDRDQGIQSVYPEHFADGGHDQTEHKDGIVPVKLAGGEFVVLPEQVRAIGGGDLDRGFKILDQFVLAARKRSVRETSRLPGPKRPTEK